MEATRRTPPRGAGVARSLEDHRVKVAVIGSGISGLGAALLISQHHDVTLLERDTRLGGHAHTHDVALDGRTWRLDTGFLVFNERTYPNFIRLLRHLGVEAKPSDMSFSVRCRRCGLEYGSRNLATLFAQPWRLVDPAHLRLLLDIPRFFRNARAFLASGCGIEVTLGDFLDEGRYGPGLAPHFVLPMTGAIWSASYDDMRAFPARSILQFLDNHGLLAARGAPPWFTIAGASRSYVDAIAQRLRARGQVRTGVPVTSVARDATGVNVELASGERLRVDRVVMATHADQALAMLSDATDHERDLLGRFRYSMNHTVLHADATALPTRRAAWSSWNCEIDDCRDSRAPVSLTYHINRLQSVEGGPEFCVSLNRRRPIDGPVLAEMHYTHPILDRLAVAAQPAIQALNGTRHTFYCGAHLRHGFHEDGLVSALNVARHFGGALP
jgi:predicted NAD/FAD-binding protein